MFFPSLLFLSSRLALGPLRSGCYISAPSPTSIHLPRRIQRMVDRLKKPEPRLPREFPVHIHLLGTVDFEDCLALQRRLAYDALTRADGRIILLICEHPPLITLGRAGS